eukprot:1092107-Prorocentrum_minimum.AAC.2
MINTHRRMRVMLPAGGEHGLTVRISSSELIIWCPLGPVHRFTSASLWMILSFCTVRITSGRGTTCCTRPPPDVSARIHRTRRIHRTSESLGGSLRLNHACVNLVGAAETGMCGG